ncbi:hypothetical protein SPCG_1956 [Streptococcus pneumoniae CGSP14]|nr:hypothetical protein SPCG_1956 [Streptococcus pneumoniae CGSP14]EFL66907.1 hypothetical protein CGSSp14BS292_11882 [Streptococcus pneumoniae SP14-BS292]EFL68997.1 hypothetical protein CGSSpBS293_00747 [Streptococcus pneumoniae SP-BS293]EFL72781.1 hypothetical protein CGSSpBS458_05292 [Streptococcus pneumoniae BS458]EFL74686.1 hypothetical protein CGSSpBS457_10147 [Streptococcus pneumoniae BS457]EFL75596.1 hypothetical protein CGSSpBS397_00832 [Streptococcus pneumoniae BS397]
MIILGSHFSHPSLGLMTSQNPPYNLTLSRE